MAKAIKELVTLQGFSRIKIGQIGQDGNLEIVGDSGWRGPNEIVNEGFQDYIIKSIGSLSGSKYVTHMGIGTGSAPNATHTSLDGETGTRETTSNSVVSSKTLQCTAEWASDDHPGGTPTVANVGLFNTSSGGTMLCGNTYTGSSWGTNQAISATYQLRFQTTS